MLVRSEGERNRDSLPRGAGMPEDNFLPTVIGILEQLHAKSSARGAAMLTFLLDLARTEAEDELKTAIAEANLRSAYRVGGANPAWH